MIDIVERSLLPKRDSWADVTNPIDPSVTSVLLDWAWAQSELKSAVRDGYRLEAGDDIELVRASFFTIVQHWLAGRRFGQIANMVGLSVDDLLSVHTTAVSFVLQTLVEQGIALLGKLLEARSEQLAPALAFFPEHLRFGVPTAMSRILSANGVRHRRAAIDLAAADPLEVLASILDNPIAIFGRAESTLLEDRPRWLSHFGTLVFENTVIDLAAVTRSEAPE